MKFLLNDDVMINAILNGDYTGVPDGHAIYFRYPLSGLLSLLYRLLPWVPWFSLFLIGCYIFAIWAVSDVVLKRLGRRVNRGTAGYYIFAVLFLFALLTPQFFELHYTVCAAVLCAGAIFLAVFGDNIWVPSLAFAICYCVRREVFLLASPFLLAALIWRSVRRRDEWKKAVWIAVVAAAAAALFMGVNAVYYRGDAWKGFTDYNRARTDLYDYSWFKQYEEIGEVYQEKGVSYEQYLIVEHYALGLAAEMDVSFLEAVREATLKNEWQDTPLHTVKRMMVLYRDWILTPSEPFTYVAILMYLAILSVLVLNRKYLHALIVMILGAGRSAIWLYLFWRGRFPERIMMSLFVIELFLLLAMFFDVSWSRQEEKKALDVGISLGLCAFGAALLACGIFLLGQSAEKQAARETDLAEYRKVAEYFQDHPDNTYLLDVRSMGKYTAGMFDRRMIEDNVMLAGGWTTHSPLMDGRYEALGATDGGEALATLDRVYYVMEAGQDYGWLEQYLQTRYPMVRVSVQDTILAGAAQFYVLGCEQ